MICARWLGTLAHLGAGASAGERSTKAAAIAKAKTARPTLTYACALGGSPEPGSESAHAAAPPAACHAL